jgi:hypothetical protein
MVMVGFLLFAGLKSAVPGEKHSRLQGLNLMGMSFLVKGGGYLTSILPAAYKRVRKEKSHEAWIGRSVPVRQEA